MRTKATNSPLDRRRFLCLLGGAAASLPLLPACTPPEEAEPPPTTDTDPRDPNSNDRVPPDRSASGLGQRPGQAGGAAPDDDNTAMLPRLDESDTMAQALGYKHDASLVNAEQFPSRAAPESANEVCRNCVHFEGQSDQPWAPCTIFPGHLVNADGWCSAWAAQT